ncbi:response regulator [Rhizobium sp. Leaf386]|uniref:response regulator n=1 Tax=Rhizobium sp. Leaf386 TaxID=1736359 RepID=UPI00138F7A88
MVSTYCLWTLHASEHCASEGAQKFALTLERQFTLEKRGLSLTGFVSADDLAPFGLPNGMNGRQLADAVLQAKPGLPVIFITGYAEKTVLNDGDLGAGMRVMTKPFATEKLAQLVREVLSPG